jgi:hypothetical protein
MERGMKMLSALFLYPLSAKAAKEWATHGMVNERKSRQGWATRPEAAPILRAA